MGQQHPLVAAGDADTEVVFNLFYLKFAWQSETCKKSGRKGANTFHSTL